MLPKLHDAGNALALRTTTFSRSLCLTLLAWRFFHMVDMGNCMGRM